MKVLMIEDNVESIVRTRINYIQGLHPNTLSYLHQVVIWLTAGLLTSKFW